MGRFNVGEGVTPAFENVIITLLSRPIGVPGFGGGGGGPLLPPPQELIASTAAKAGSAKAM